MARSQPRPLVFISHSARGDEKATKILTAIRKALAAAGVEALIDSKGLKGGDQWRDRLHTWMGHCHGAVLLLSRKALKSDWVLQEATILTGRRFSQGHGESVDGQFPLLPVLVDITMEGVAASAFGELALPSIQALHQGTPARIARDVVQLLRPLKRNVSPTPRKELELKIANNLRAAGADLLRVATGRLGVHPSPWAPAKDVADILASRLLEARPEKIPRALSSLHGAVPAERLREIANMLGSLWVKSQAAAHFATIAGGPAPTRAALLNAKLTEFTSRSYVARAGGSMAVQAMIPIAQGGGEDYYGAIVAQIREHFRAKGGGMNDATPERIRAIVATMAEAVPVVIVLPPPLGHEPFIAAEEIGALLETFASCTLLVLTGPAASPGVVVPNVRRLDPPLAPGEEDQAFGWYTAIHHLTGA